jgi:signal peptidase I
MRLLITAVAVVASAAAYAQPAAFHREDLVRVKPSPSTSQPTSLVLRIVAVPNDRIRLVESAVLVNDVAVTDFSKEFLARVAHDSSRTPQVVPEGHYFVMGEARMNQDISEYWGQHSGVSLERAQ